MHYLLKYDDGDEEHVSWRAIQIGIRNTTSSGFIDVAHQHSLSSGQLSTGTGKLWSLRDASSQDLLYISVPIFPEMEDIIEDTDGCSKGRRMLGELQDPLPEPSASGGRAPPG